MSNPDTAEAAAAAAAACLEEVGTSSEAGAMARTGSGIAATRIIKLELDKNRYFQ